MATQTVPSLDVRAFEYLIKKRMKADPTFKDYDFEGSGLSAIVRFLHQAEDGVEVADVEFYEAVVGLIFNIFQVGQVAGIGERY